MMSQLHFSSGVQRSGNLASSLVLTPKRKHFAPRKSSIVIASVAVSDPFKDKYPSWDSIQGQLVGKYNLQSVSPEQASSLIEDGKAVLCDVRLKSSYEESHPSGSISAPAFRVIEMSQGGGVGRMMKMVLMAANGVTPTENNPDFAALVTSAISSDKIAILACEAGGTTSATTSFPTGKPSRSLKAAWKLLYTDTLPADRVLHLDGGVIGWYRAGLPMSDKYDPTKAFNTPNAIASEK